MAGNARKKKKNKTEITWKELRRQKVLIFWAAVFVIYGFIFCYLPLGGWLMAFQNYKPKDGILHSKFIGLAKFQQLFSDTTFLRVIRNTLAMGVINLVLTFVMAIAFAILLNEVKSKTGKKTVQTISYLPHYCYRDSPRRPLRHRYCKRTAAEIPHSGTAAEFFCLSQVLLVDCGICKCMERDRLERYHLSFRHHRHRSFPV